MVEAFLESCRVCLINMLLWSAPSGVRGIFFKRGKITFPDFFRREMLFFSRRNFHFGRPLTNFSGFKKWPKKKKKKKKGGVFLSTWLPFLLRIYIFYFLPSFLLPLMFSLFSSPFSLVPSLFPRLVSTNIPVKNVRGAQCPPPVYATDVPWKPKHPCNVFFERFFFCLNLISSSVINRWS